MLNNKENVSSVEDNQIVEDMSTLSRLSKVISESIDVLNDNPKLNEIKNHIDFIGNGYISSDKEMTIDYFIDSHLEFILKTEYFDCDSEKIMTIKKIDHNKLTVKLEYLNEDEIIKVKRFIVVLNKNSDQNQQLMTSFTVYDTNAIETENL